LSRTRRDAQGNAPDTITYQYDPNGNLTRSKRERAGTTTARSYRTESGHNKPLGFSQTNSKGPEGPLLNVAASALRPQFAAVIPVRLTSCRRRAPCLPRP